MKRLFKPMILMGIIGSMLLGLGLYWMISGWRYMQSEGNSIAISLTNIALGLGVLTYGYRIRSKQRIERRELLGMIGIGLIHSMILLGILLHYGRLGIGLDVLTFLATNVFVGFFISLYSMIALTAQIQKERKIGPYVFSLIGTPVVIYYSFLLFQDYINETFVVSFLVLFIFIMCTLSIQILGILRRQKGFRFLVDLSKSESTKQYKITTALLLIVLPYIGLLINWMGNTIGQEGLVGNFNYLIFWIVPILNGAVCLVTKYASLRIRKILFYLKWVGFSYMLYFSIAFIPLMPLGLLGIVFYGLGLLTFIPILGTVWQGYYLIQETKSLWQLETRRSHLFYLIGIGLMSLPLLFGAIMTYDMITLKKALVVTQEAMLDEPIHKGHLKKVVNRVENAVATDSFLPVQCSQTPLLSHIYMEGISQEISLSKKDIAEIKALFFADNLALNIMNGDNGRPISPSSEHVKLNHVEIETHYDEQEGIHRSWVHLTLKNESSQNLSEYATSIDLPMEAYVSDYYLFVGDEKKYGMLTDQRAATTLYHQIVRSQRDPGLLKYHNMNTLELRVFPFSAFEERYTGFEIIHKNPITIQIDQKPYLTQNALLNDTKGIYEYKEAGVTALLSHQIKELPKAPEGKPFYYFLIDGSTYGDIEGSKVLVEKYIKQHQLKDVKVLLVTENIVSEDIEEMDETLKGDGGFHLRGAIKYILKDTKVGNYPVIIAVSPTLDSALLPELNRPEQSHLLESSYYYLLKNNEQLELGLQPYPLYKGIPSKVDIVTEPILETLRLYEGEYIIDNGTKQFIYTKPLIKFSEQETLYEEALLLEAMSRNYINEEDEQFLECVQGSFKTRLLMPETAFMVVETKEQEKRLMELQEAYLSGRMHDGEGRVAMDEPSWMIYIIAGCCLIGIKKYQKKYTRD